MAEPLEVGDFCLLADLTEDAMDPPQMEVALFTSHQVAVRKYMFDDVLPGCPPPEKIQQTDREKQSCTPTLQSAYG